MSSEEPESEAVEPEPGTVRSEPTSEGIVPITFEKSQLFRVIHVDGCWGGLNHHLDVRMTVFNERPPIPKTIYHLISPEERLGPEVAERREGRRGIFRECEAELVMSPDIARSLAHWLLDQVARAEKLLQELPQGQRAESDQDQAASNR